MDIWEARGIAKVFGPSVPVFAAKGFLGNLGAASGTTELIASILGLSKGVMPASLNCDDLDPECSISVIVGDPRPTTKAYAVKVGFTQMGQCVAVVIKKGA